MSGIERHDPSQLRISDDDRYKVSEFLRLAAGEGRLDLEELEERLEATYAARTYGDLIPITADLPQRPVDAARTPVTRGHREVSPTSTSYSSSWVVMGETKRQGAWLVPEQHTAFALMGEVTLDLREATFSTEEVTINASAIMAQVTVVVDAYTRVVMQGFPLMGEFSQDADKVPAELGPDSPTVHVKGLALMGAVNVVRQPAPGTPKRYFGSY